MEARAHEREMPGTLNQREMPGTLNWLHLKLGAQGPGAAEGPAFAFDGDGDGEGEGEGGEAFDALVDFDAVDDPAWVEGLAVDEDAEAEVLGASGAGEEGFGEGGGRRGPRRWEGRGLG